MSNVLIAEGRPLQPPTGSAVLFESVVGPMLAIAPREGFEDAVLGFPLLVEEDGETVQNTNWPRRPSFPVFLYNAARYLGGSRGALTVASVAPGSSITLRSPAHVQSISVQNPRGETRRFAREGQTPFAYTDTLDLGVYQVQEGQQDPVTQRFVVNLFDPRESNLQLQSNLELGHESVAGQASSAPTRHELWKWILAAGLVVLVFEWYVYNRRVYL